VVMRSFVRPTWWENEILQGAVFVCTELEAGASKTRAFPGWSLGTSARMERPSVYIENGHVTTMTLAVIDTVKEHQHGNDGHGSKVVVIPFDGAALDRDLQAGSASR